jgi:hypothetical protein
MVFKDVFGIVGIAEIGVLRIGDDGALERRRSGIGQRLEKLRRAAEPRQQEDLHRRISPG